MFASNWVRRATGRSARWSRRSVLRNRLSSGSAIVWLRARERRMASGAERQFDLIAMGRAAVDFYGEQIGSRLEDMASFAKYLGGSAANTAVGSARLGLRVAMLTRVGDEHMGR